MRHDTGTAPADSLHLAMQRVVRRMWIAHIAEAGAAGAVATSLALVATAVTPRAIGPVAAAALGVAAAAIALARGRSKRTLAGAARDIERSRPDCRNVVITARELMSHPERASAGMRARVLGEAAARAGAISPAEVVPLTRPLALLAGGACICAVAVAGLPHKVVGALRDATARAARTRTAPGAGPLRILAELRPPAYTGIPARDVADPARLDVVQGTHVRLVVSGPAAAWRIRFGTTPVATTVTSTTTVADVVLTESGYFAIEPSGDGRPPDAIRRLLPVSVSQDRAPVVRIEAPGRDLLLPDATSRIPVAASAADDFGLQSFELRYTKVSGTGEQFEFEEGTLPLSVTPLNAREWKARAEIALPSLKLDPGDSLVYRAVARDARPDGAGFAASDTFFIEIAGPGQVALAGFDLPPERERYALSQQMIVLKIQRLRAREAGMTHDAIVEEASAIAAEQRAVRANFIFLMGGHVEDEEVEAEQSSEIQEGRLQNSAHKEITAAITYMGRAAEALAASSTGTALPPAKAAVEALQRAFGRNRYILRTLPVRSRVDPSRRLTGELAGASDWQRDALPPAPDRETQAARALLSRMLEVAAALRTGIGVNSEALTGLAEEALAIDPASAGWQQISSRIAAARDAVSGGRVAAETTKLFGAALEPVMARAQKGARLARTPATDAPGTLLSAWADASRK